MKAEWVLRSSYKLERDQSRAALVELLNHADVATPELDAVLWTLDRFGSGADLTDMLHVVGAAPYPEFASFDTGLGKQAGTDSPVRVIQLQ